MSAPVHPYDLAATLAAARAVTFAAMDGLPNYHHAPGLEPAINHLGHLITGLPPPAPLPLARARNLAQCPGPIPSLMLPSAV